VISGVQDIANSDILDSGIAGIEDDILDNLISGNGDLDFSRVKDKMSTGTAGSPAETDPALSGLSLFEVAPEEVVEEVSDVSSSIHVSISSEVEAEALQEAPGSGSGIFSTVTSAVSELQTMLPSALSNMKYARTAVSALSSSLTSLFETLDAKGSKTFDQVASLYRTLWVAYFVLFVVLTSLVLFYSLWASGYAGGPQSVSNADYEAPKSCWERLQVCCASCSACMKACQDSNLCFWSVALLLEVLVLVLFVVALVLCILAGIKAFMSSGCASIYIMKDDAVCSSTMTTVRSFLDTFWTEDGLPSLTDMCDKEKLLTCDQLGSAMATSVILMLIGGIMAGVFSYLMIIESAFSMSELAGCAYLTV